MVERDNREISIKRQAELLGIHRTNVYRRRDVRQEAPENVQLMHEIDKLYTKHPYFRLSADDKQIAGTGMGREPQTHPAADAPDGN